MSQICGKCNHANPPDAVFCYFDGVPLEGHRVNGGPVNAGAQLFPNQFVFPTGQACRNFDQLAMACQQNWQQAIDLLKQGYLKSFFGGLGRVDLAMVAQEAASNPDTDRGLDLLLTKLPTQVLENPKLSVEPKEINLGVVPMGTDKTIELVIRNQGMRLLYGSIVSNSKWLTLGESPGHAQKIFQCCGETVIQVNIRGQHLRAGTKPLEGLLEIESNGSGGGGATIKVHLEVPPKPFPEGVLAGALSPRQVAEKALPRAKEAAPLFENGTVSKWFVSNGWPYPVQGPAAAGLGAVQQYFEALGVAKAPKVSIDRTTLNLEGAVGQSLQTTLEVKTEEKRPVYAHATCDQSWLNVSKTKLNGRVAIISVLIGSVPDEPGTTLNAKINVQANGNQRFTVPLSLAISGARRPAGVGVGSRPTSSPGLSPPPLLEAFEEEEPVAATVTAPPPLPGSPPPVLEGKPTEEEPFGFKAGDAPILPSRRSEPPPLEAGAASRSPRAQQPAWVHIIPAAVLAFIMFVAIIHDLIFSAPRESFGTNDGVVVEKTPRITIHHDYLFEKLKKGEAPPKDIMSTLRFGLTSSQSKDGVDKRLTFGHRGHTNSTVLRIDNRERAFGLGGAGGKWVAAPQKHKDTVTGKWLFEDVKIQVVQKVELIPGEPVFEGGEYRRLLDTCLVRYEITNQDSQLHKVGVRFLLDTLIGLNDGVPFTVPGLPKLVDKFYDFTKPAEVPDFIQALEEADLKNPGTIAQLNLKVGGGLEPPSRVSLTRWPGFGDLGKYEIAVTPMDVVDGKIVPGDSAAVLYWEDRDLPPGQSRKLGFSYGLGSVATEKGTLGITIGGAPSVGGELTVVAYVSSPQPNQTLTLEVPSGMTLLETTPAQQGVPPAEKIGVTTRPSQVSWRLRPTAPGNVTLRVTSSTGEAQQRQITITSGRLFN